jgi:hypothetical protein
MRSSIMAGTGAQPTAAQLLQPATCAKGGVYLLYLHSCASKYRYILYILSWLPVQLALHAMYTAPCIQVLRTRSCLTVRG